jgi:hypothetical protein
LIDIKEAGCIKLVGNRLKRIRLGNIDAYGRQKEKRTPNKNGRPNENTDIMLFLVLLHYMYRIDLN